MLSQLVTDMLLRLQRLVCVKSIFGNGRQQLDRNA
jgi:hypothetical protein